MSGKLLSFFFSLLFAHLMIIASAINCSSGDKEPTRYVIFILWVLSTSLSIIFLFRDGVEYKEDEIPLDLMMPGKNFRSIFCDKKSSNSWINKLYLNVSARAWKLFAFSNYFYWCSFFTKSHLYLTERGCKNETVIKSWRLIERWWFWWLLIGVSANSESERDEEKIERWKFAFMCKKWLKNLWKQSSGVKYQQLLWVSVTECDWKLMSVMERFILKISGCRHQKLKCWKIVKHFKKIWRKKNFVCNFCFFLVLAGSVPKFKFSNGFFIMFVPRNFFKYFFIL